MNRIYLDHAATTPVSETVLNAMLPFLRENAGNASAIYGTGREARKAVEKARNQVADALGAKSGEIIFTGGGSESDNLAVKGTAFANKQKGRHLITTAIEHPAVLNSCRWLEKHGFEVTYVMPDRKGCVDPEQIRKEIRDDTILISVMAANNEIGTLEPVAEIGEIARERGILFHIDAVQAVGAIPVDVNKWNADLLSLSAHKFRGPKGTGALYIRKGTRIDPLISGGEQERKTSPELSAWGRLSWKQRKSLNKTRRGQPGCGTDWPRASCLPFRRRSSTDQRRSGCRTTAASVSEELTGKRCS